MITITPQGQVYLCKTPLENDYKNQLTFANATAQQNYFASKVFKSDADYTYIKKDNTITVNFNIDEIINCNYLFYENRGFTNKIYYCFITNMEYVNENATRVYIETDVYQTYMFDIVKKSCFVEREHTNDDTIGNNTVPEDLDTGEFIINEYDEMDEYGGSGHVVIGVTKVPDDLKMLQTTGSTQPYKAPTTIYNGVFSGLSYFVFKEPKDASQFITIMDLNGVADNIVSVFICPNSIYNTTSSNWTNFPYIITWPGGTIGDISIDLTFNYNKFPEGLSEIVLADNKTISLNTTLNGYTPKNNKMFTKEFNYLYITNNNGNNITYAYEDFINNTPKYRIIGAVCPGCSIRLIPENYKKYETSGSGEHNSQISFGLVGGKYPTCSWRTDIYTNWVTQQGVNHLSTNGGISRGEEGALPSIDMMGAISSGVSFIKGLMSSTDKKTKHAQTEGNINVGDVTYACGMTNFLYFKMSCRYEYAKRIDDFLNVYGYKVNEFKIPNIEGRTYWNYVKTVECNFEGDIPQMYLNKIKEIFNNGVTFWHDPTKFLDYSQSNTIVTPTP